MSSCLGVWQYCTTSKGCGIAEQLVLHDALTTTLCKFCHIEAIHNMNRQMLPQKTIYILINVVHVMIDMVTPLEVCISATTVTVDHWWCSISFMHFGGRFIGHQCHHHLQLAYGCIALSGTSCDCDAKVHLVMSGVCISATSLTVCHSAEILQHFSYEFWQLNLVIHASITCNLLMVALHSLAHHVTMMPRSSMW